MFKLLWGGQENYGLFPLLGTSFWAAPPALNLSFLYLFVKGGNVETFECNDLPGPTTEPTEPRYG